MDPLTAIGAVASICQLASAALALSKSLYTLGEAISSASDDMQILADDLKTFSQSLTLLSRLLEDSKCWYSDDIYLLTAKVIKDCAELYVKIDKLLIKLGGNGKRNWKLRVKFVYKEEQIKKLMKRLRDMKGTLATILMSLQVDLQLSLLNISSSSKIQREPEKALQPETVQTLMAAYDAVKENEIMSKYGNLDGKRSRGAGCATTSITEPIGTREAPPQHAFSPMGSFKALAPQPSSLPPLISRSIHTKCAPAPAVAMAMVSCQTAISKQNESAVTIQRGAKERDCESSSKSISVRSITSSSSMESFKSALSAQEEPPSSAEVFKAIQSVLHAFKTALQILRALINNRIDKTDYALFSAAKAFEHSLAASLHTIERSHSENTCRFSKTYLESLDDTASADIRQISTDLMADVVMTLHVYSAEHEELNASCFQILENVATEHRVRYLHHVGNLGIISFSRVPKGWRMENQTKPALGTYGIEYQNSPGSPLGHLLSAELSLPFIGYTFKRFDSEHRNYPPPLSLPVQTPTFPNQGLAGISRPSTHGLSSDMVTSAEDGHRYKILTFESEHMPILPQSPGLELRESTKTTDIAERQFERAAQNSEEGNLSSLLQSISLRDLSCPRNPVEIGGDGNHPHTRGINLSSGGFRSSSGDKYGVKHTAGPVVKNDAGTPDSPIFNPADFQAAMGFAGLTPNNSFSFPTDFHSRRGSIVNDYSHNDSCFLPLEDDQAPLCDPSSLRPMRGTHAMDLENESKRLEIGLHKLESSSESQLVVFDPPSQTPPSIGHGPSNLFGGIMAGQGRLTAIIRRPLEGYDSPRSLPHHHRILPDLPGLPPPVLRISVFGALWWKSYFSLSSGNPLQQESAVTLDYELRAELKARLTPYDQDAQDVLFAQDFSAKLLYDLAMPHSSDLVDQGVLEIRAHILLIMRTVDTQMSLKPAVLGWICVWQFLSIFEPISQKYDSPTKTHGHFSIFRARTQAVAGSWTPPNRLSEDDIKNDLETEDELAKQSDSDTLMFRKCYNDVREVVGIIARYAVMESLYSKTGGTLSLKGEYQQSLVSLCCAILEYFATVFRLGRLLTCANRNVATESDLFAKCDILVDEIQQMDKECKGFRVVVDTKEDSESGSDDGVEDVSDVSWEEIGSSELAIQVDLIVG